MIFAFFAGEEFISHWDAIINGEHSVKNIPVALRAVAHVFHSSSLTFIMTTSFPSEGHITNICVTVILPLPDPVFLAASEC